MSLSYDITRCPDPDALTAEDRWPVTSTLIMLTPVIGIGAWSAENAPEVFARLRVLEAVNGPLFRRRVVGSEKGYEPRPVEPSDVAALVGLRTNVAPETRASFVRRLITDKRTGWLADLTREYERATRLPVAV